MGEVVAMRGTGAEPAPLRTYGGRAGIDVCLLAPRDGLEPVLAVALVAPDTFGTRVLAGFPRTSAGCARADVTDVALTEALEAFAWYEAVGGPIAYRMRGGRVPELL